MGTTFYRNYFSDVYMQITAVMIPFSRAQQLNMAELLNVCLSQEHLFTS